MVGRKPSNLFSRDKRDGRDSKESDRNSPSTYLGSDSSSSKSGLGTGAKTTVQAVTTAHITSHFFSLPNWKRRPVPAMASAVFESRRSSQVLEDGRIVRAGSHDVNMDANVNKALPEIPDYELFSELIFARRSTGSLHLPSMVPNGERSGQSSRSSSSSPTLMPPHSQSAHTLAHAGLGIGLPHVMPQVARSASKPVLTSSRPKTAPRPTRLEPKKSQQIRRISSFTDAQEEAPDSPRQGERLEAQATSQNRRKTIFPASRPIDEPTRLEARPEPKSLMRKASFWTRRRVQSLKDPPEAQRVAIPPAPALPTFYSPSPMFPDKPVRSSPVSTPRSSTFETPGRLRRRHSERSTSSSHQTSPRDAFFTPNSSSISHQPPHRPFPRTQDSQSSQTPSPHDLRPRPTAMSFISSPAISSFPTMEEFNRRPRSNTNPNVLHRLSMGLFSSSPSSPISSTTVSTSAAGDHSTSPRTSVNLTRSSLSKSAVEIPKPKEDEETPEEFLSRLEEIVSKAEIANVLAGSGDSYYTRALQLYIDRFNFANDPLDIALRRLLMDVGLPKETQQIDRVMEAFATSYKKCNSGLFLSDDHPYILSFSLIMLHTDAFNRSNKRKMTKADYIKNTRLEGVPTEVLDYFFDNIVFAPFIFIEDPVDVNGQRSIAPDGRSLSTNSQATPSSNSGLSILGMSNKIDPYYLITQNQLDSLRVDVESYIPLRNPFSYQGTAGSWNEAELRRSFARAEPIEVDNMDSRRASTLPFFSMNVVGAPGPSISNFAPMSSEPEGITFDSVTLKVTKAGILSRKDDLLGGGKRAASRKWREWSFILTGSQLLCYRDSAIALELIADSYTSSSEFRPSQYAKPDETLSLKDAIAVYDASYHRHPNVFRLVLQNGRQCLLRAQSGVDRNEWIAHINYASTFRTTGIRMRSVSALEDAKMDARAYDPETGRHRVNSVSTILSPDSDQNELNSSNVTDASGILLPMKVPPLDESTSGQSRSRIIMSKIQEFETKIEATRVQLESDIRVVRNLSILAPFRRATRERLQTAIINLGGSIKQLRLEIIKTACYRDVLATDLASEDRERRRRKKEALELEERIRSRDGSMPRMTPSLYVDEASTKRSLSHRSDTSDLSHAQADPSICESFHSALDFGADWPHFASGSSKHAALKQSFDANSPMETPSHELPPGSSFSSSFFPSQSPDSNSSPASPPSVNPDENQCEEQELSAVSSPDVMQQISEELAEDWDKTKAAKRVSLVHVPTGLKVSSRSDKDSLRHCSRSVLECDEINNEDCKFSSLS